MNADFRGFAHSLPGKCMATS